MQTAGERCVFKLVHVFKKMNELSSRCTQTLAVSQLLFSLCVLVSPRLSQTLSRKGDASAGDD